MMLHRKNKRKSSWKLIAAPEIKKSTQVSENEIEIISQKGRKKQREKNNQRI